MQSVLIIVHLIIVLALVGVVLLQRSEGGGLGMGGGSSSGAGFMTGRGQANVLTRTTAVLAALFFLTSLGLTILAGQQSGPRSIFDGTTAPGTTAPTDAPSGDSGFERLQRLQESETPQAPAPAQEAPAPAPAAPAPTGPQVPNFQ
ncbi:preprotein translocase subunit SecG [Pseudochelatococcus sp. B33]